MPTLTDAVQYANANYYSKPMTQLNLKVAQIHFPFKLLELCTDEGYEFHVRRSHGLLHALAVMELIDSVDKTYLDVNVEGYKEALELIRVHFVLHDKNALLELLKVTALMHDAARLGDGIDVWDEQSADACYQYLVAHYGVDTTLAELLSDTIRFKDDKENFLKKYRERFGEHVDFLRQLINMADTLEVMRTRHVFKPEYLPIDDYVTPKVMVEQIIPNIVVPHRDKIIAEGRMARTGVIQYLIGEDRYDDSNYQPNPGYQLKPMASTYLQKSQQYTLSVLKIDKENIEHVLKLALKGINTYINEYKNHSGVQLFHNGLFSPRYHGDKGLIRAGADAASLSEENSLADRAMALYFLLVRPEGPTLKEAVLTSFNQFNAKPLSADLKSYLHNEHGIDIDNIHSGELNTKTIA